jgi:hypothetical protein
MSSNDSADPKHDVEDGRAAMNRAVNQGELFVCGSIASELARLPGQFEVDQEEKWRILGDLAARCDSGYFKDDETIVCFGEPPRLVPIREIEDVAIIPVMLTRAACKRYVEQSTSPNAPRLLRAWFRAGTPSRRRRRHEKRPQIEEAVRALAGLEAWENSPDGQRCAQVEEYLNKPSGWCTLRTLQRAIQGVGTEKPKA